MGKPSLARHSAAHTMERVHCPKASAIENEPKEFGGTLAFVHSLNHVSGTLPSGHTSDLWLRWTACFRRIDGVWLVVHNHASVPADLEHGQAVLNLRP